MTLKNQRKTDFARYLDDNHITIDQFARKEGYAYSTVANWSSGKTKKLPRDIQRIIGVIA